jgi:hypothetical protein
MMKHASPYAIALILATPHCARIPPPPEVRASSVSASGVWERLVTELPGEWDANVANGKIRASYELVSSSSALVETFTTPSGKKTLTVYHREGANTVLTHYCAQKNQARLRATLIDEREIRFDFERVTDLDPGESVLRSLVITRRPDGFEQKATYRGADGHDETESLAFHRP